MPHQEMLAGFQRQLASLNAAVAQTPDDIKLRSQRGDVRLFLGRFREAIEDFERMIALDPAQDAPHWRLGIAYYFAGEHAKSAKQFEKYHAYDARDRENGIWKFLAQAKVDGLEKARAEMLAYTRFDREPFPSLYEMFAGRRAGEEVLAETKTKGLEGDAGVMFFAHYYVGLNEALLGRKESAREHLRKAVTLFSPQTARRGGPGYMWQVARLHLETLSSARRE